MPKQENPIARNMPDKHNCVVGILMRRMDLLPGVFPYITLTVAISRWVFGNN